MQTSRISQKGQVTLPKKIRQIIGVHAGDILAYEVNKEAVTIRRIEPFDAEFHATLSNTLDEWNTPDDEEAFQHL